MFKSDYCSLAQGFSPRPGCFFDYMIASRKRGMQISLSLSRHRIRPEYRASQQLHAESRSYALNLKPGSAVSPADPDFQPRPKRRTPISSVFFLLQVCFFRLAKLKEANPGRSPGQNNLSDPILPFRLHEQALFPAACTEVYSVSSQVYESKFCSGRVLFHSSEQSEM